jgi:type I restriction enzyme, S subunit
MNPRREVRLKDISTKITKGTTPTTFGYPFTDSGINFIKAESVTREGLIDPSTFAFIDEKTHALLKRSQIEADDILLTIAGIYLGKVGIVRKEHAPANTNQAVAIVRIDKKQAQLEYVRYFLFERSTTEYLNILCPQSAQPNLNLTQLGGLRFMLPPLPIQRKIAAVLAAYDDLIEANRRRIALLERMAEEIYREWFVRLRFPGHATTKITKGLPAGWRVAELKELATVNPSSLTRRDRPEKILYVDISSVSTNQLHEFTEFSPEEAPGRARRRVQHGDVIWSSVRPANRAYCLIMEPPDNLIVSTGFAVIRPKPNTPFSFLFFAVTSNPFVEQMTTVAKGAAYPATAFDDFEKAKILVPTAKLLADFHQLAEPHFRQKHLLQTQNAHLTRIRDLLLPRLISGKLPVEDLPIAFPPGMAESG